VGNKHLLEYVVEAAAKAGVEEIVLIVGYKRERIQNHFGDGDDWGVDIEYAVQEKQLGTGHAILQAEPHIDGPFLVLNGDRILESRIIGELIEAEPSDEALLAVTRSDQPSDYGVVEVAGDHVTSIAEKPPQYATVSDIINAGVYRFGPDVFDVIRATETEGELTVTAALQRLVEDDRVRAVRYDGFWLDVSYLWDYLEVNTDILDGYESYRAPPADPGPGSYVSEAVAVGTGTTIQPNATVLPGTALGDNVTVEPNAVVANSIVLSDSTIGAGVVLRDCIVGENVTIGANTTVEGGQATERVAGDVFEGVRLGGVIGDNATLGGNVTVAPGTSVGTATVVEGGSWLRGHVPSNAGVRRG
jgi:glucose-1-phosphate thymidylyltransferase